MVFVQHIHDIRAYFFNVNAGKCCLQGVRACKRTGGFMVQQSAEQAALVALTARQCHGVPADGKAQVILPRQAAHLTHQAVKSRCADINLIAQVVQVQAAALLYKAVQDVGAAVLRVLRDVVRALVQHLLRHSGRNAVSCRRRDDGILVLRIDCIDIVMYRAHRYPQRIGKLGSVELLVLIQQCLHELVLLASHERWILSFR